MMVGKKVMNCHEWVKRESWNGHSFSIIEIESRITIYVANAVGTASRVIVLWLSNALIIQGRSERKRMNKYFTVSQAQSFAFYKVPKALFVNEKYKDISTDAKMLYGLLLDRIYKDLFFFG